MCTTSQRSIQCLTDLILLLVAVESIFENPQSALLTHDFQQCLSQITLYETTSAMSDSTLLNTWLLQVVISSDNEYGFIGYLSGLSLWIIFNTWWASINVGSKQLIASNPSGHATSWWRYLHSRIDMTGSPGILYIICHQVLCHPSEHGTSSMGKYLWAKAYITMLNEWKESDVTELTGSMIDETYLAIRQR